MIVFPKCWDKNWGDLACEPEELPECIIDDLINRLYTVLNNMDVNHLAYSGGIDSSVLLSLLTTMHPVVHSYTIVSRADHPDLLFSSLGCDAFGGAHKIFVVKPNHKDTDTFIGDNAVRQLFEMIEPYTNKIICGDGVDEFVCGYNKHKDLKFETYKYFLEDLLPGHLVPLNRNSGCVKVYLPYLDAYITDIFRTIPLKHKVDKEYRKKVMIRLARRLCVPDEIINRQKYGFIDAFIEKDKDL